RLRAGEDGDERRGVALGEGHAQGHGLPRRAQQAGADHRGRGAAHRQPGAGGRGQAAPPVHHLRGGRAGARGRRAVHLLQRHDRRGGRGARPGEGEREHLRPFDAGGTGIRAGREGL
ncbi:MAG: Transcription antitermination protein NusG, partial [uncultured Acetobacteraceae bacterium]